MSKTESESDRLVSGDHPDGEPQPSATGQETSRDDITDTLPLPNDPVDATGLLSADDLNGEAPD